jgi:hypothetical protein
MEAKVDLRKLQLLNDRICQTIDALNQVRLSVHGLSHTAGVPGIPFGAYPSPIPGIPGVIPQNTPFGAGFQHSNPWVGVQPNIYGMPMIPGVGLQHTTMSPFGVQQFGVPQFGVPQFGVPQFGVPSINPWLATQMSGLAHTNPDIFEQQVVAARAADPFRLSQSFPFAFTTY